MKELWIVSCELTEKDMIGAGIGESEMDKLEQDWLKIHRLDSRDKIKHIERYDQLFVMRIMLVAKQE